MLYRGVLRSSLSGVSCGTEAALVRRPTTTPPHVHCAPGIGLRAAPRPDVTATLFPLCNWCAIEQSAKERDARNHLESLRSHAIYHTRLAVWFTQSCTLGRACQDIRAQTEKSLFLNCAELLLKHIQEPQARKYDLIIHLEKIVAICAHLELQLLPYICKSLFQLWFNKIWIQLTQIN
jgi:hypothetical protein